MTDHQYTQCIGLNCVFESINVDWRCWILVFSRTNWTVLLFVHCTSNILCSLHVCAFLRTKTEWFWTPLLLIMIICIWQTYSTFTNKIENKPCIPTISQSPWEHCISNEVDVAMLCHPWIPKPRCHEEFILTWKYNGEIYHINQSDKLGWFDPNY